MCRHLSYLGPRRSLASLLFAPERSLERQSWNPRYQREGAMNADGWGVGWWDLAVRPEPARYRTAAPMWTDRSFHSVAEVVHAGAFTAATRSATPPAPIVPTGNAPFAAGPWLFSLNGYLSGFRGAVGEGLRRLVSERRSVEIDGTTDTEVVFALVLDALDGGAAPPVALAAVMSRVLRDTDGRLNLLLTDGAAIVATTYGNSLFTLRDAGLAAGGVLVASEPLDHDEAWTAVPDGSVVRATTTELEITPLATYGGPA